MNGPHTVTLLTPGAVGLHGVVGEPTPLDVPGCIVYPRGSTEEQGRSSTVITGKTVLAPPGTVVTSGMQVKFRGVVYNVEGDVGEWDFFDGDPAGVQINIEIARD